MDEYNPKPTPDPESAEGLAIRVKVLEAKLERLTHGIARRLSDLEDRVGAAERRTVPTINEVDDLPCDSFVCTICEAVLHLPFADNTDDEMRQQLLQHTDQHFDADAAESLRMAIFKPWEDTSGEIQYG